METVAQEAVKVEVPQVQPEVSVSKEVKTEDILSRVNKFVEEKSPEGKAPEKLDEEYFNDAELQSKIDSITDPALKTQYVALRKSLMRGANDKFKEISELRKEFQAQFQALKENSTQKWTPERIQQALSDPEFIAAASQVAGVPVGLEDADIPDSVKAKLAEVDSMKQQLSQWEQMRNQEALKMQHENLRSKYSHYNPDAMGVITKEILEGKSQITLEHIFKATDYENAIQRAYRLGLNDRQENLTEKKQSSTPISQNITQQHSNSVPYSKEDSNKSAWSKIIANNLLKMAGK